MAPHRPIDQAICAISGLLGYFSRMTVSSPSRPSPAGRAWVGEKRSGRPALRLAGRRPAPAR